ncbi:MAG: DUF167 domain-containing protein [Candidatus ainarchaeum sp.]|jgi:hypothetical protein|nr:DUF167 domain-containing protein [Candidatus ainarchaeum sp.]MDD3085542.1 DUF167 domain-containing protein [Candidatus ainarchaeum sp.]MDD4128113.1 DUF167 domain-containing protein [Candidatus ainarchaeum sp.]MDD4467528.1 DUF167 domain-containing protein [Candidatus ainarchaeum sp.]HPM85631.1 DUF167 domain-containing protein [archaeon]
METVLNAKISTGKKEFKVEFDKEKNIILIKTTQQPDKNKANKEILKELKKFFNSEVKIVSGIKSKEKKININLPKKEVEEILQNTN